jgi:flagellar assembly protein FliH
MSSRIIRPADGVEISPGVEAKPIVWRASGVSITQTRDSGAAQVPEVRAAEIQQEAEARIRTAYNQGLAAGEAAAQQRAQQKLDPVLHGLNTMIAELASLRKRVRAEAEDDAVKLAIAIARRVLYRELATDPEAILGLVKAAFSKLNARETHRLRVSPSDAQVVQEHRAKLQIPPGLEIAPDGSLTTGSVIFETSRGELDASVDTQLSEIDRGLTDALKRRK